MSLDNVTWRRESSGLAIASRAGTTGALLTRIRFFPEDFSMTIAAAFACALLARLNYGAVPLTIVIGLHERTGSFATGGWTLALFGLATISMPAKARLIDRRGQHAVLPPLALLYGGALLALLLVPVPLLPVVAVAAGFAAPPVGPSMRARWSLHTPAGPVRARAIAIDTVSEEALYVLSPALAGALATWSPSVAIVVVALLGLVGGAGLGLAPGAPPPVSPPVSSSGRARRFALPDGLAAPWAAALGFGAGTAMIELAVTSRAVGGGAAGWTGLLIGAFAAGSVVGGLLWGRRTGRRRYSTQLAVLLVCLALGAAGVAATPSVPGLFLTLPVAGLFVSPTLIVLYLAVDDRTAPERRTEANTWIGTFNNLGSSAGSALAGTLVAVLGARPIAAVAALPFVVAAAIGGLRTVPDLR